MVTFTHIDGLLHNAKGETIGTCDRKSNENIHFQMNSLTNYVLNNLISKMNNLHSTNGFIPLLFSSLKLKNILIIHENATAISDLDMHGSEYFTKIRLYSVDGNNFNRTVRQIFQEVNVQHGLQFVCIGSFQFLKDILNLVNNIDFLLDQQAYFIHLHKWLLIEQGRRSCSHKLLNYIDKIDNIICMEEPNDFVAINGTIDLRTAMYGNSGRYWQTVNCPFSNNHEGTSCSLEVIYPNTNYRMNHRHVHIGTKVLPGYIDLNNNGVFSGMFIELLQDLALHLNFTYDVSLSKDNQWGLMLPNGTWNGLIGELSRREIDFAIAPLARNQYRDQVMDFSDHNLFPYYVAGIYKLPPRNITSLSLYLQPFEWSVYVCLFVAVSSASILFSLKARFHNSMKSNQPSSENRVLLFIRYLFDNLFLITSSLIGQSFAFKGISRQGNRSLNFACICLCGIVLVTLWSARIVSHLTVNVQAIPIRTFDDLLDQNTYKFGFDGSTNLVTQFSRSKNPRDKQLWAKLRLLAKEDPDVLSSSRLKHTKKLESGNYVFIASIDYLRYLSKVNCDYVITKDEHQANGVTLGLQTNTAFKPYFDEFILRMTKSGALWRRTRFVYPFSGCQERVQTKHKAILFELVLPIFYGLFGMAFIACVVLWLEIVFYFLS